MRPLRSVRSRLLLMVMTVVLVAVAAVVWSSRRATEVVLTQFIERLETEMNSDSEAAAGTLAALADVGDRVESGYRRHGDWVGAAEILADAVASLEGRPAMVVVGGDVVVAASDDGLARATVRVDDEGVLHIDGLTVRDDRGRAEEQSLAFRGPSRSIRTTDGSEVGVLFLLPTPDAEGDPTVAGVAQQEEFLGSVDRRMLGVVIVVGALALAAATLLSARIVGPIERLTEAARLMGQGRRGFRVEVGIDDEIGDLAAAFNAMAASLEHNERLRRDMVSDVAHELRTPLTNLRAQLESVQDGLAAPTPELITSLHEEAMLLNHLVDDLQDLALADAGQLRLQIEDVDVAAAIATVDSADLTIALSVDAELPPVRADARRLRQVLRNLVDNAARHGGGTVRITARTMVSSPSTGTAAAPSDGSRYVAVTVTDDGPGIAAEQLARVFERFYRTDPSRQRATGGAGLGLAIVRQLVEAQGGSVWAESEPGNGCTFSFCLPVAERSVG